MVKHPANAGLAPGSLQPGSEIVRGQLSLHREKEERIPLGLIEGNRAPIERNDPVQCLGNRAQEGLLGEVRNNGIVYLKQAAVPLFTLAEYLFGPFPPRNVDEGDDCASCLTLLYDKIRPILYGKAGAVFSPEDLIVSVDPLTFLKAHINRTFFEGIGRAVFTGMVLQRVHVLGQQLPGIAVAEHARSRSIGEKTSTFCIAAENPLGC